jgi:hypothetical protein
VQDLKDSVLTEVVRPLDAARLPTLHMTLRKLCFDKV